MTREEFEQLQRRFGEDIAEWPAPYRQEAMIFLASEDRTASADEDGGIDRLVLESVLAPTDEQALARKSLARIDGARRPVFAFPAARSWSLPAAATSLALVLAAAAAVGYTVASGNSDMFDDALLAFAAGDPSSGLFEAVGVRRDIGGYL